MTYNEWFFEEEGRVAAQSAAVVVPWLVSEVGPTSAVDVGCGTGEWVAALRGLGVDAFGVDGFAPLVPWLERADLTEGYDCSGYDLAISLEVAEHLPSESAEPLVEGLCAARVVLFSAATVGQQGIGHINCQPHDYWHGLFEAHGKLPEHVGSLFTEPVADFYRRNCFLYR